MESDSPDVHMTVINDVMKTSDISTCLDLGRGAPLTTVDVTLGQAQAGKPERTITMPGQQESHDEFELP